MKDILAALQAIEAPGSFYTRLTIPSDDLSIRIGDGAALRLPITHASARRLIKQARPAKFGRRAETLTDKRVRDTWEIPRSRVKIDKRRWNKTLQPLLERVSAGLGLSGGRALKAELHNLLIYETGQFFQPHQDSEKQEGMVASLVIVLPCEHRGGGLVIDHAGEKKTLQSSRTADGKLSCIAFYADCHHEVKPVTAGYRLALTYNLVLRDRGLESPVCESESGSAALSDALQAYFDPDSEPEPTGQAHRFRRPGPSKWVYMLDHQYTQHSLKWNGLKRVDQIRADMIRKAARELDLRASLALVEVRECWDCIDTEEIYGYRGYRRYGHADRETVDPASDGDRFELNDLVLEEYELAHWLDEGGSARDYGTMGAGSDEICWTKATSDFDPFESEYEGYMGNYGNTLDRWYHRAAIVLWRNADNYLIQFRLAPGATLSEIEKLAKAPKTRAEAAHILASLMPDWKASMHPTNKPEPALSRAALQLALALDDDAAALELIAPLGLRALNSTTARAFCRLAEHYGEAWTRQLMDGWWARQDSWRPQPRMEKFEKAVRQLHKTLGADSALLSELFDRQLGSLQARHQEQKSQHNQRELSRKADEHIGELNDLLLASLITDDAHRYEQITDQLTSDLQLYPALNLAEALLFKGAARHPAGRLDRLRRYVQSELNRELAAPVRADDDWAIHESPRCTCDDCKELARFLHATPTREKVWPMAKKRRQHIHQCIDAMSLAVSHQTRRQGSPYSLILCKTDALFTGEAQRRRAVRNGLDKLAQLDSSVAASAGP